MVKMFGRHDNGRRFFGIGLSHGNLDRLRAGQPILINREEMKLPAIACDEILVFAGETEEAMRAEFEAQGLLEDTVIIEESRRWEH